MEMSCRRGGVTFTEPRENAEFLRLAGERVSF